MRTFAQAAYNRAMDAFIPPGTRVRLDGAADDGPEYGIVVHCWQDDAIGAYDCYVAFFGDEFPSAQPREKPYVLRYAASSLTLIDA